MRFFKHDDKAAKQARNSRRDEGVRVLSDAELAEVSGGDKKAPAPPPPPVSETMTLQFNKIGGSY